LEDKYPCPLPKPLVFLKKDDKLPPIAVTVPKMGFRPDSGCIANPRLSEKEAAGTVKPVHQPPQVAGNTALQSCYEEVVLGPGCCTHPAQSATSPITETSQGQTGSATNIPVIEEATSPSPSQKESGQSASTCFMTPNKIIEDGIPAADEHVLERAKRRTARWNLDSPAGTSSPGNISSTLKFPVDICVANLKSIGISMGSSSKEINVSLNALKRIEVDKVTVQPKK